MNRDAESCNHSVFRREYLLVLVNWHGYYLPARPLSIDSLCLVEPRPMLRFTIRDLLWLTVLAVVAAEYRYRFIKRKTPATMASSASKSPLWAKLNFRNGAVRMPNNMSHAAKSIMPKLFGSFAKKFMATA